MGSGYLKIWGILFISLFCSLIYGQIDTSELNKANLVLKNRGEVYFSFHPVDSSIRKLSRIISIDKVADTTAFAYANKKGFQLFLEYNKRFSVLPAPCFQNKLKHALTLTAAQSWNVYPTYDQYVTMMQQFASTYPNLCQLSELGTTVGGRKLLALKISGNGGSSYKPAFFFASSIHGDELTGYVLMLRLIDYLLTNYNNNATVTSILDSLEVWVLPLANPDGTYFGGNSTVASATRSNGNSVDINRNFPDPVGGPHPDGEQWQPETKAYMTFFKEHHPVLSAMFHGGSEVVNYPWDIWVRLHPDDNWYQYISRQYADTVQKYGPPGYFTSSEFNKGITNGYQWYSIAGGMQDYVNYFAHERQVTIEISDTKTPDPANLPNYWNYNFRSFLDYMKQNLQGVQGVVLDSLTLKPLMAEIQIPGHDKDSSEVYSDNLNGSFVRLLLPGTYNFNVSAKGYLSKNVSVATDAGKLNVLPEILLVPDSLARLGLTLKCYPNPFTSSATIEFNLPEKGSASFTLFDLTGRKIRETESEFNEGANQIYLNNLEYLKAGVYLGSLKYTGGEKRIKLIKLK